MNEAHEVKLHFLDYWRIVRVRSGLISLTFLLVMITAGVTTYFLPRQYFSKVTVEVKPDKSGAIDVFNSSARAAMDPAFLATQFQILQKTEILYAVIDNLKLRESWAVEGQKLPTQVAAGRLLSMMSLKDVRATRLIEIGVWSTDAQEAANVANTIAVVYREKRLSDLQKNVDRGLQQLREEVEKQRTRVEEAAANMTKIRERDAIIDPDPESFGATLNSADRNMVSLEGQTNEQRLRVMQLSGQLEQIEKLKPEELKEALRTLNIEDPTIVKMVASLQDAVSQEANLTSNGLGELHPRIRALRAQREVFSKQLTDSLNTVRRNQANKLEVEERTLNSLTEKFNEAKKAQLRDKQKITAYVDAKSQYLQAKKIFEAAQVKYSSELLERGIDFEPAKVWEKAEPAGGPSKPNVSTYMAVAVLAGLTIGVSLAFFIEYLDTSVKTLDDVEKYLQVPVLAVVPKDISMLMNVAGDTSDAETYRILRANVEFNKPDRHANTFTLVSGGPGEGKSTTLNNLAFTCAKGGYNVLVIDADLRRPKQHTFFKEDNDTGLTDYLIGQSTVNEIIRTTKIDNLSFMPSGPIPGDAVGILNSQRMVDLLTQVKRQFDLVFIDSPPILGISDGSVLASECDITIMVVQHRRFPRAMLLRVKQAVLHAGGKLIGVVLNNVDAKHDGNYAYYNNYNEYYAPKHKAAPLPPVSGGASEVVTPVRRRSGKEEY